MQGQAVIMMSIRASLTDFIIVWRYAL